MTQAKLVIVGAGHAGISAAIAARKAGHSGPITMIAREGAAEPYERPPLSKWSAEEMRRPIFAAEQVEAAALTVIEDDVVSLDTQGRVLSVAAGGVLSYDRLLLATGAAARKLAIPGAAAGDVYYLRDHADAEVLRRTAENTSRAVMIGGGFIGLELAASLRGCGVEVDVIEMADRLLARAVSPAVAKIVQDLHVANGVSFTFAKQVSGVTQGNQKSVTLDDGTTLPADLIVAGVGSVPETNLATAAGLRVENGIVVDSALRTTDPNVYAAGDCCAFPLYGPDGPLTRLESWQMAGQQGDLAGRNMVTGNADPCAATPWFWSEQYDHTLQVAGVAGSTDRRIERAYGSDQHVTFCVAETGELSSACGIAPGTKIAKDIRFSMKMIEAGVKPPIEALADPDVAMKSLLRG